MKLLVRRNGVVFPEPMTAYIERRVRFTLGRFASAISRVSVHVADVNGPRGGVDTLCRIEARVQGQPPVVVEDRAPGLRESFDRAIDRIGRTIRRGFAARHSARRHPGTPTFEW